MTKYLILSADPSQVERWIKTVVAVEAASAEQAIRKFVEARDGEAKTGTFVAIPARSWNPRTVKVETQTRVVFDETTGKPATEKAGAA